MKKLHLSALAGLVAAVLAAFAAPAGAAEPGRAAASAAIPAMPLASPEKAPLVAVTGKGTRWVAVGDYGTILHSGDGGANWQQAQSVPYSGLLTAAAMADERIGWAVGHGGTILRTDDGGANWRRQAQLAGGPVLLSVAARDARNVLVVGAYGTAVATHDGGDSWQPVRIAEGRDGDRHLNHVFIADGFTYIAAEAGGAYRSGNGWNDWTPLSTGVGGSLWGGFATAEHEVVLYGMSGRLLVSRDRGATWRVVDTGLSQSLTHGIPLADGRIAVVGNGGAMASGRLASGALRGTVLPDRRNINALAVRGGNKLALFGAFGLAEYALPD
ncbi:MAG: hypothetical protein HYU78_17425 [Rhodocyclales bacterium]|nr:hypothetical protein [Rhodocyclales bacterium]